MFSSVRKIPVAVNAFCTFGLPMMLVGCALQSAAAQCSQATRPVPQTQAAPPSEGNRAAPATDDSSWSNANVDVRFAPGSAITVLENTTLQVITDIPISSRTTKEGAKLPFTITRDVVVDGVLVIPCGARVFGSVVSSKQAGRLVGASSLTLQLTELDLDGKTYSLYTPPFKMVGASKTRPTVKKAAIGATVAAVAINADIQAQGMPVPAGGRARGTAVIAGVGAGIGTAIAASSPPSIAIIPSEAQIEFTLATPIAVFPVDQRTAVRLAQGMHRGGPVLYIRGENQ